MFIDVQDGTITGTIKMEGAETAFEANYLRAFDTDDEEYTYCIMECQPAWAEQLVDIVLEEFKP